MTRPRKAKPDARHVHSDKPVPRSKAVPAFTPVRTRARHDGWTPECQTGFIEALAECACVDADAAADEAGAPRPVHPPIGTATDLLEEVLDEIVAERAEQREHARVYRETEVAERRNWRQHDGT